MPIKKTIEELKNTGVDVKDYTNIKTFINDIKSDLLLVSNTNTRIQKLCLLLDPQYVNDSCHAICSNKKMIAKAFTTKQAKNG